MRLLAQFSVLLNAKRLAYAWIVGGVLWLGWLVSILLGPGNRDLYGQLIGADFLAFYTGGKILLQGQADKLYDLAFQQTLQRHLTGSTWVDLEAFVNPPFWAWVSMPFAALPYLLGFAVWTFLALAALWFSLRLLQGRRPTRPLLWSLTWFPIFATISFGQNSLLSLFLFCLVFWLWRKDRMLIAGLVSSMLLFKPQWVIGLGILWLLDWRRSLPALVGLGLGGAFLASLSFWQLPRATAAYVDLTRNVLPNWQTQPGYQLHHLHTVRGFWLLLLPKFPALADLFTLLLMAVGVLGFVLFWRRNRDQRAMLFAGMICLTIWLNPHVMIYDWAILLIPAALLWQEMPQLKEGWKALFATIWLVTFASSMLTAAQLRWLPFAVQFSVPVFLITVYVAYRWLVDPAQFDLFRFKPAEADSVLQI
jgi:alpha-1,2-mannosyltransferase